MSGPPTAALDEATRPKASLGLALTPAQQATGAHLRRIHDAFRAELTALEARVEEVRRGEAAAADVRAAVSGFAGAFGAATDVSLGQQCAQVCRLVTLHHTLEDSTLFPALGAHARLKPVVERLAEEHAVIHEHLAYIDALATRVDAEPDVVTELAAAVAEFGAVVRSHFRYEEDELSEPMGLLGIL